MYRLGLRSLALMAIDTQRSIRAIRKRATLTPSLRERVSGAEFHKESNLATHVVFCVTVEHEDVVLLKAPNLLPLSVDSGFQLWIPGGAERLGYGSLGVDLAQEPKGVWQPLCSARNDRVLVVRSPERAVEVPHGLLKGFSRHSSPNFRIQ